MSSTSARRRPPPPWLQRLAVQPAGTAQQDILEELRSVILAGHAPPGAPINVDDVADRFVVSRIPVREALKTLIGEGLVEHEPRAGYQVAQLTRTELAELYVVREALEVAALTAAVAKASAAHDTAAQAAYAALSTAIASGDTRGHHRESRRFHFVLAGACGMQRLLRMLESAWNLTEPLQPMSHASHETTGHLQDDHRAMLAAFEARDVARLLAASAAHYRKLQDMIQQLPVDRFRN
jgi:DNA-binding GntR family transcriptional regulator